MRVLDLYFFSQILRFFSPNKFLFWEELDARYRVSTKANRLIKTPSGQDA
jgi:hypothetical protein